MSFGESIRHVLANLTNFEGRARRSEFWWFYLFMQLVSTALAVVFVVIIFVGFAASVSESAYSDDVPVGSFVGIGVAYLLMIAVSIALSLMMLAVQARRLHDTGQTAHWLWLHLAGLGIVPLIMCIMEGEPHANQYGPDPKAGERYYGPGAGQGYAAPPAYGAPGAYGQGAYAEPPSSVGPPMDPFAVPPTTGQTPPPPAPGDQGTPPPPAPGDDAPPRS